MSFICGLHENIIPSSEGCVATKCVKKIFICSPSSDGGEKGLLNLSYCSNLHHSTYCMLTFIVGQYIDPGRDLPRQPPGSHFDSQTQDLWEDDTQLYFARFSVFV